MKVKIEYETRRTCKSCKKPIVPNEILINNYWGTKHELPSMEAKLELVKQQLAILTQEKDYRIKFGVKE